MSGNYNTSAQSSTTAESKDYWRTPENLLQDACDLLGVESLGLDACARDINTTVCPVFIDEQNDALKTEWNHGCSTLPIFCNPPFSQKLEFVCRAIQQVNRHGRPCLMVLPYEPVSKLFTDVINKTNCIIYVPDGRYNYLKADGGKNKNGCNFPTCLVYIVPHFTSGAITVNYRRGKHETISTLAPGSRD